MTIYDAGSFRTPQPRDADALADLWNRSAPFSPMDRALLEEKLWGDPDYDSELVFVAGPPDRPEGLAMGVVRGSGEARSSYVKLLAVVPERRRQGIGARLLDAVESALVASGASRIRIAESAPNYLAPGVDVRYEEGQHFLQRHGYQEVGRACNLQVHLQAGAFDSDDEEGRLLERGIDVRRAAATDWPALQTLLAEFGGTWREEVHRSMESAPPAAHLAFSGDELLGFAVSGGNNSSAGWFGPMGTAPAARGLGIGAVLLRRCLRDLQERGFATAVIPWVGPVEFYEKHANAVFLARFVRLEKHLGDSRSEDRHAA